MLKHPEMFEELFVCDHDILDRELIINSLQFPKVMTSNETTNRFSVFATGLPVLPGFSLGKIEDKFDDGTAIFVSTCVQSLTLPRKFPDKSMFNCSMVVVINSVTGTKPFNCA